MAPDDGTADGDADGGDEHRPLPPRPPRPVVLHWLVDAAVAFLAIAVVGLFLEVAIWVLAVLALAIGAAAAPVTHSAEARALAERDRTVPGEDSLPSGHDDDPGSAPPRPPRR